MRKIKLLGLCLFIVAFSGKVFSQDFNQTQNFGQQQNIQQIKIGFVNSNDILKEFPEKNQATEQLLNLSKEYESELQLMQSEYNKKYSDYITYQASLAENIKLRRMQELTELENRIQEFMSMAQKILNIRKKKNLNHYSKRLRKLSDR